MTGPRRAAQGAPFHAFSIEDHAPADPFLRRVDRFVDPSGLRQVLAPDYSSTGRPSIDPELMIRMLIAGCRFGARSERRLRAEARLNPAYRRFRRLDLGDPVPDRSTFSKNRRGRFRAGDLFRRLFEDALARRMAEGLAGGDAFGVDASLIKADASRRAKIEAEERSVPERATRATQERLDTLDDAAFGGATPTRPKTLSPADPAARFAGADGDRAFFACGTNRLVDLENAVIVDVEAAAPVRRAETGAARTMIRRAGDRFGLHPETLAADTACGSADMPGRRVEEEGVAPRIPVFDKSERKDGACPAADFACDRKADPYARPGAKLPKPCRREISKDRPDCGKDGFKKCFARRRDCAARPLTPRRTPNRPTRKIARSRHEGARRMTRDIGKTDACVASSCARKNVERLLAHLKRILGLDRLRLRGPNGAGDEFRLAAMARNLRKLAKLVPEPA